MLILFLTDPGSLIMAIVGAVDVKTVSRRYRGKSALNRLPKAGTGHAYTLVVAADELVVTEEKA